MTRTSVAGRLGLGLAAAGRPRYINLGHDQDLVVGRTIDDLRVRTHELLDAAWDLGVRYVDTARSYGLGEAFLGDWLRIHPGRRAHLTIGSKWGYTYVAGWDGRDVERHEIKDHSLATFERQWPETLAALGGPPDLYLVHSLTEDSPVLGDGLLLERLRELAATGVRVGLSTSGPAQARTLRAALALPDTPFSVVQSTWNLLEPSCGATLAEAYDAGWLVVVKEAVANGRLTPRGDVPAVARAAESRGMTPDALAIGAALANPWAGMVLSGASTTQQLASNLATQEVEPAPDLVALAEDPETYWAKRSSLSWI
jgi:aryl-alcohol dehydrogenase-like predicted oxidoreductase